MILYFLNTPPLIMSEVSKKRKRHRSERVVPVNENAALGSVSRDISVNVLPSDTRAPQAIVGKMVR